MIRIATGASMTLLALSLLSASAIAQGPQNASIPQSPQAGEVPSGDVQIGIGVVCDTGDQVRRFATLSDKGGDIAQAIKVVNKEADNPAACAQVVAAYVRGKDMGEVHRDHDSVTVAEITIFAVPEGNKWQFVSPVKQYTAFPLKGIEI
jgi:hypothetical protein